jgi:endonuclease-3
MPANRLKIERIFSLLAQANPHPVGELHYKNNYTLLVAVMLSAQATDKSVNAATTPLFAEIDRPEKMLALGQDALEQSIRTIGLYRTKAKHVMAMSTLLIDRHDGRVPDNREALEALPGVGRKTANVVLNIGFGQPTLAVDTHVYRVSNRLGIVHTRTPLQTELALLAIIPAPYMLHAHHWLILHGRYICQAKRPRCSECPLKEECDFWLATP